MSDEIQPEYKSLYTKSKDGSIVTNTGGKLHSVQKQVQNPDGSWRMSFEISKEQPIVLFPLQENERYMITCEGIFEFINY